MRKSSFFIATIVLSIFALLWNGFIHLVVLADANKAIESIHRPDMADKMWISIIITICIVVLFIISFLKWRKTGSVLETIGHSLFFAAIMIIVVDLNQYVQYEIPFSLVILWSLSGAIEFVIYGLILNLICKKEVLSQN